MYDAHFYGFYTVNKTILSCNKTILSCNKTILPVIKPLQPVRKPFHNSKLLLKYNKRTMLHEEDVDLEASLASGTDLMPKRTSYMVFGYADMLNFIVQIHTNQTE